MGEAAALRCRSASLKAPFSTVRCPTRNALCLVNPWTLLPATHVTCRLLLQTWLAPSRWSAPAHSSATVQVTCTHRCRHCT